LSDTTIEVAACPTVRRDTTCSFAFFRWENGILKHSEEPVKVKTGGFVEFVESTPSADGKRMFFDFNDRDVGKFQHLLVSIVTVVTLGMGGPEDVNREECRWWTRRHGRRALTGVALSLRHTG
jgi:hypothetical protein